MRIENNERDMMFWTRQVLNIIFMLAAIIGVICYVWGDKRTGIFVVLGAMVVKMAESTLRMLKK